MARSYKIEGVVIKKRNFLEKDRILTLFTHDRGKIEVLAKGARRPGSRLSYTSDIGTVAKFNITSTRSIDIVMEADQIIIPETVRGKFDKSHKLFLALKYSNELFELDDPHPRTYKLLVNLVKSLSKGDRPILFLSFILNIISDLGLEPELFNCNICDKRFTVKCDIVFSPQEGFIHKKCCQKDILDCTKDDIKLMRIILNYPFQKVAMVNIKREQLNKTYKLVREYFSWHFGKELPERLL